MTFKIKLYYYLDLVKRNFLQSGNKYYPFLQNSYGNGQIEVKQRFINGFIEKFCLIKFIQKYKQNT